MTHYRDLNLLPSPEFNHQQLLNQLFHNLHLALVGLPSLQIAVSFPHYHPRSLGNTMRLLGHAEALEQLLQHRRFCSFIDLVDMGTLAPVPAKPEQRTLRRVQAKTNPDRLRRRAMKRHHLDYAQACEQIPDHVARSLNNLPYLQLNSSSSAQRFRLYLRLQPSSDFASGPFNRYGLSHTATIPWF